MQLRNTYVVLPGHICLETASLHALVAQVCLTACGDHLDTSQEVQGRVLFSPKVVPKNVFEL